MAEKKEDIDSVNLPVWLVRANRSAVYKTVYALLISYLEPGYRYGGAEVDYTTLCSQACITRKTLSRALSEMEEDGLIIKVKQGNRPTLYSLQHYFMKGLED